MVWCPVARGIRAISGNHKQGVKIMEKNTTASTATPSDVYRVHVVDNRVRLFKGRDQISFQECDNYKMALDVAEKLQKEYHTATPTVYAPLAKVSAEKAKHNLFLASHPVAPKQKKERKAKKEKIVPVKTKDELVQAQESDLLALALLEGKSVLQLKQEMGLK